MFSSLFMKHLITILFLFPAFIVVSQELPRAVKKINPTLFINNIDNERIYQQANVRKNLVVFSRGFENRSVEEVQQSFHYRFLDEKDPSWILELQFDHHLSMSSNPNNLDPLGCSDFGLKVYQKKKSTWKDVTLECLPDDFLKQVTALLPVLQKGSLGMYFYNQVPEQGVQIEFDKSKLTFKQNGKTILTLQWKKGRFNWKK